MPILPGTDFTAFCLGMMYHQVENNPKPGVFWTPTAGVRCRAYARGPQGELKDYLLGTYDGEPKTLEWARLSAGVPAATTRRLAEEIAKTRKVDFFWSSTTTKIPAGEMFGQAFYTLSSCTAWEPRANYGMPRYARARLFHYTPNAAWGMPPTVPARTLSTRWLPRSSCLCPIGLKLSTKDSWEKVDYTECWQSILDGAYGRDTRPGGKKPLDIHTSSTRGGYENSLNSLPNPNAGIKVFRKVDSWGAPRPSSMPSRQYCDIVPPVATGGRRAT